MGILGDYGINEKGKQIGDYVYRDRTLSGEKIKETAMMLEEKFDYIKVKFFTSPMAKQRMIHYKNGFEGPAKNNSVPKIDGNVYMRKGELTLNYQLPVMRNGVAFVVDTNHNREKLRRLLKKEKSEHYEYYYEGNKPQKKKVSVELGPYIELLTDIDIGKNRDGVSHIMSLSPADKAVFEALQKELEETKKKLDEKPVDLTKQNKKKPAKPKKAKPKEKKIIPELTKS